MILGGPKLKTLALGAQYMTPPKFDLFQMRVLLTKCVYFMCEMLILILNEQLLKLSQKHNIALRAH